MQTERDKLIDVRWFPNKKEATNWIKIKYPNKFVKLERPTASKKSGWIVVVFDSEHEK